MEIEEACEAAGYRDGNLRDDNSALLSSCSSCAPGISITDRRREKDCSCNSTPGRYRQQAVKARLYTVQSGE